MNAEPSPTPSADEAWPDRWHDWGGQGPLTHLAHANGFPPGVYRQLIGTLRQGLHIVSTEARSLRPGAQTDAIHSWEPLADDLALSLQRRSLRGCIGIGHSLGGVSTLLAASREPTLFSAIVLIDPLLMTGWIRAAWAAMKLVGLGQQIELVRRARRRRMSWPDRQTIRRAYSGKSLFRSWAPGVLDDYLDSVLIETGDGVSLRYPAQWEARIFELSPHDLWPVIRRLEVPALFIRGANSDTFSRAAARRLGRIGPPIEVEEVPGAGHLVPMEKPEHLGRLVRAFITEHQGATESITEHP